MVNMVVVVVPERSLLNDRDHDQLRL